MSLYTRLAWLPPAPADFTAKCKKIPAEESAFGEELRRLAQFALDENQLFRLHQTLSKARKAGRSVRPLAEFRLGLLSNATTDFLAPAIVGSALRYGFSTELIRADFGQVMQEALLPDSKLNLAKPDAVLVALDYRWYPLLCCPGNAAEAEAVVDRCLGQLQAVRDGIRFSGNTLCIFQTLAPPPESLFGSLDHALPGTMRWLIERFNVRLAEMAMGSEDLLLDVAGLAQTVGLGEWHDPTPWNLAKVPFSHNFLPLYADHVARTLASLRGKSRRCLILDLDNTVWGGVIGDDGLEGIQIAQGDATGEAHLEVQRIALALRSRGIVLAVSSKNTDEVARRPFLEHPEMLLKLDHIAVFQANWNDKATNIKAIAETLSLGLESMVFLDDNPVERDLVRQMLPQVAVPELPKDPAFYARTLAAAGYFEATRFSAEDMARAGFYQDNSRRVVLQREAGDIESYLRSLQMEISFQPFDETGRVRIAQLISKSNQFNLTTRRYSENDVRALGTDTANLTLQIRLVDSFGDNGMISVVVCRPSIMESYEETGTKTLEFDTWLMSCRVLGRRVEQAVLQEVLRYAQKHGYRRLLGRYIPTERNALVEKHYEKLGFHLVDTLSDGTTLWEMGVAPLNFDLPMTVHRIGYDESGGVSDTAAAQAGVFSREGT